MNSVTLSFTGFMLLCMSWNPELLVAQDRIRSGWTTENLPSTETILREFACESKDWRSDCSGRDPIDWIFDHRDEVRPERVTELLNGLEQLALGHDDAIVRASAVSQLAVLGMDVSFVQDPMNGILPRLLRIYAQSDDDFVRYSIIGHAGWSVERAAAVAFLSSVAQQAPPNEDFEGAAERAVRSLATAGTLGPETLRALDFEGRVRDPAARRYLEYVSKFGYRVPSDQQLRDYLNQMRN